MTRLPPPRGHLASANTTVFDPDPSGFQLAGFNLPVNPQTGLPYNPADPNAAGEDRATRLLPLVVHSPMLSGLG